ncbi:MAG: DUF4440 domain-containing protein [Bacteroidota bacterium]|nr:DUF4440 domain-containing protein [Bacteroidota bacterium]
MNKRLVFTFIVFFSLFSTHSFSQSKDKNVILEILHAQEIAWNSGNIESFMRGYWNNDSLMFIGKSGINYGWEKTLKNYKKSYPDTVSMGKLAFTILQIKPLATGYYFIVGEFHLERKMGNLQGYFDLLFKKINGKWLIVADHTS